MIFLERSSSGLSRSFEQLVLLFYLLEGSAPYGGQTSSSCGGLVAFGHQMGALRAPWLVKSKFEALCAPPTCSCRVPVTFSHLIGSLWVPRLVQFWIKRTIIKKPVAFSPQPVSLGHWLANFGQKYFEARKH